METQLENELQAFLPCHSRCFMLGAATCVLSVARSAVLINGPHWCASIAESELKTQYQRMEERIFCSEAGEPELLFGTADGVVAALREIADEQDTELLGVINSCAISLIGEDLQGICRSSGLRCPVVAVDGGGLRGEFAEGYGTAWVALLKELQWRHELTAKSISTGGAQPTVRVNLWAAPFLYPGAPGDAAEIERLLALIGVQVNLCLGPQGVRLAELQHIGDADLNLVLYPETGLAPARHLHEALGQPYLVLPVPYGIEGTRRALTALAQKLGIQPDWAPLDKELALAQERLDWVANRAKVRVKEDRFGDIFVHLPQGQAAGLLPALREEFPDAGRVFVRVEGRPASWDAAEGVLGSAADALAGAEPWPAVWGEGAHTFLPDSVYVLLGNSQMRSYVAHYNQMIFVNMMLPYEGLELPEAGYAGVRGWLHLIQKVMDDFYTLTYAQKMYYSHK